MDTARTMLGPPTLASLSGGRGRAQLLSRGRNTAPAMIGDFFGGGPGTQAIILGLPVSQTATANSQTLLSGFTTNSTIIQPNGTLFGTGSAGSSLLTAPGVVFGPSGAVSSIPGLILVNASGLPIAGAGNTFTAAGTGQSIAGFTQPPSTGPAPITFDTNSQIFNMHPEILVQLPNPGSSGGGLIGRVKISENTSPMPRDRVFFNYSSFSGVPLTANDITVNRFTPGFEKTLFNQMASVEMRFPFAATLDNTIIADGVTNTGSTLFGDMSIVGKALLYTDDSLAVSAGLQVAIPTADDLSVRLADGTNLVEIQNDTVHLMPFLGALYTPGDRFYAQGFFQVDTPANGNRVYVNDFSGSMVDAGTVRDVPFAYVDLGAGYWLYRNDEAWFSGFAPTLELHYNRSLATTNVVRSGLYQIGSELENIEMLNMVVGSQFHFGLNTSLTLGYATPLGNGPDQVFHGELRAFFNYRFGPQTFRSRTTL